MSLKFALGWGLVMALALSACTGGGASTGGGKPNPAPDGRQVFCNFRCDGFITRYLAYGPKSECAPDAPCTGSRDVTVGTCVSNKLGEQAARDLCRSTFSPGGSRPAAPAQTYLAGCYGGALDSCRKSEVVSPIYCTAVPGSEVFSGPCSAGG